MSAIAIMIMTASTVASPIVIGLCWWMWFTKDREERPRWRTWSLGAGLVAVSMNALTYCFWLTATDPDGQLRSRLGNNIALPLIGLALVAAIAGKGTSRILIAVSAVMGFFMWIGAGVL